MSLEDMRRRLPIVRELPAADDRRVLATPAGEQPRPRLAVWELTLRCDQKYIHCGSRAGPARPDELDTEAALRLVGELRALGVGEVTLLGGEAYLRNDFILVIRAIRAAGMACTLTRYYAVLANRHHLRPRIIPSVAPMPGQQLALGLTDSANLKPPDDTQSSPRPRRLGWAKLLARVFAIDVTVCRKCGGRMRVLEVVDTADDIARVLHGARAPPRPFPPGQVLLFPA